MWVSRERHVTLVSFSYYVKNTDLWQISIFRRSVRSNYINQTQEDCLAGLTINLPELSNNKNGGINIIKTEEVHSNHRRRCLYELKQWKWPSSRRKDFEYIQGLPF